MGHYKYFLLVLMTISLLSRCNSWSWFSSSKQTSSSDRFSRNSRGTDFRGSVAEFSMKGFNHGRGIKLVEDAEKRMISSNSCWQNAYQHLFSGCSEILAVDEKRSGLAYHLSDCFQRDSGRPPFPHCEPKSAIANCLRNLDDLAHKVYLEFYLETNTICYQLQAYVFKRETERLVTELKSSAQYVWNKLDSIDEKSENLLKDLKQIHDLMNAIDIRTQQVAATTKNAEDHIGLVLRHSESVFEQAKKIAVSQSLLEEGQEEMKRNLEDGVAMLIDSYKYLGKEIEKLRDEADDIEREVAKIGDAMSVKMEGLQNKAEDIGSMAEISLDKQKKLLDGQSTALGGLNLLSEFQSKALEESRNTLQYFTEHGHRQQEELVQRKEQIQGLHDHLMENSKSILAAQESFESKQASMFVALDKLFSLHNTMLLESRIIKAFIIYFISIFVIYVLTSIKQTYNVRPWLYIGLCATFFIEVSVLCFKNDNIEKKTWIINIVRSLDMLVASVQILYAICTYRDYEILNHRILLSLVDKVNSMQKHRELSWEVDSGLDSLEWIDRDLPDDVNCLADPDNLLQEVVGDNSLSASASTRKYNLCQPKNYLLQEEVGENSVSASDLPEDVNCLEDPDCLLQEEVGENSLSACIRKYNLRQPKKRDHTFSASSL